MALTAKVDGFGMDYELPDKQDGICFGKYESFQVPGATYVVKHVGW